MEKKENIRIAKAIADAGICSRRNAEILITNGKVEVNGKKISSPALNISPTDKIKVNGKELERSEQIRLWLYHKPTGVITTHSDPQGRKTLFSLLPKYLGHIISIGRLDINSEGLILLTNSGDLAHKLENPKNNLARKYMVRVYGRIEEKDIAKLRKSIVIDGFRYRPMQATLVPSEKFAKANSWVEVIITEGKNREIRKVFEYIGFPVNRLLRISYGPFSLGKLEKGKLIEIPSKILKEKLGI